MKKILLFLTIMLATVGMTMAQDVYTAGEYTPSGASQTYAAVYNNGNRLYNSAAGSGDNTSTAVVVNPNTNDVYWTRCNSSWGDVFKNGSIYLDSEYGTYIHDLNWYTGGSGSVLAAGYKLSDGKKYAAVWRDDNATAIYTPEFGNGYESEALGIVGVKTSQTGFSIFYCGYQQNSEGGGAPRAKVWKNGNTLYNLSSNNSKALDIAYYNNNIYTVGTETVDGTTSLKVWLNSSVLYTLVSSGASQRASIYVDAGDVYVVSYGGSSPDIVWKNGEQLYTTGSYYYAVAANSTGVYCAGRSSGQGVIWKDGQAYYTGNNALQFNDICLGPLACEGEEVRSLPFYEGFENGDTDWSCWTIIDSDNHNYTDDGGYRQSIWDRSGENEPNNVMPHDGEHAAVHRFNMAAQEGWLISPKLYLQPGRDNTWLTFQTYEAFASDMEYEGVWVSTTTPSPSAFTEVWSQSGPNNSWKEVQVDLHEYQGQAVYIAFKYTGADGHSWYIDDISVEESWEPCLGAASLPYGMDFEGTPQEPGYCWYILDEDHTGGNRCWQYNESEQCAYHPWGQNNGVKQEGWLFSPSLDLTGTGVNYTLTFNSKNGSSGSDMKNSVWISVDHLDEIPVPSTYVKIWEETNYSSTWAERTIDLTSYAGHVVNIAFKYEGTYAHNWYVDDISFTTEIPEYNINVEANNASWGTVSGGGTYTQGSTCTITATPTGSYVFLKWMRDGSQVSTNASYTFVVNESATYTAVFGEPAVTYYTITTDVTPDGAGTVTGGDTYASGATAVLTATPNQGWCFNKWNDNNTDNPRSITVTGDATYTAIFTHTTHTLTVNASPAEGGTVTGGGTYEYGQTATLNASPNEGYVFLNWSDGSTSASHPVMVTGDAEYTAYFAAEGVSTYTITVVPNDPSLGEVSGGGTYAEGTEITLTATPIGYATFVNWSDGSTKNPRTITVTEDATYTANFEMAAFYTITVVSQNPEMGSVNGGGSFPMGAEVTIQANPFGGYYFDGWTDNNYDNPRTITVSGDATYTARFSAQQTQTYMLTVTCNPGQGAVIGTGTYSPGTVVNVEAIPYEGFAFDRWNDGVTDNPRTVTVNANITLVAFFKGTGVDENGETLLSVYPNPARETIRIEGLEPNTEVSFYNTLGMLVKQVNANADQEINVSDLATGLYLVRCGRQTMRFVKE